MTTKLTTTLEKIYTVYRFWNKRTTELYKLLHRKSSKLKTCRYNKGKKTEASSSSELAIFNVEFI